MILILARDSDSAADSVESLLAARGVGYLRFNHARFPASATVSLRYRDGAPVSGTLVAEGVRYRLADVSAIWDRCPDPPAVPAGVTAGMAQSSIRHECRHFIEDAWQTLACRWLPAPPDAVQRAGLLTQARAAASLGFDLPPTLISNHPAAFLEFYRRHEGRIVSRVFDGGLRGREPLEEAQALRVFTKAVSSRDPGYAASIRYSPVVFQAWVPEQRELQVAVVGRQVFAAEWLSTHGTQRAACRPYCLPQEVEKRCVSIVERLGLNYAVIDLVLTPDGRHVFLELHARGDWLGLEARTGLPIGRAICDYLAASDQQSAISLGGYRHEAYGPAARKAER